MVTNYSSLPSLTSKLSETGTAYKQNHICPPICQVSGLQHTDTLLAHDSGENVHVCAGSNQPIIHTALSIPLDEFNMLEKGLWL